MSIRSRSHPTGGQPGFAYQPALDGVRALAVLAVMLYHGDVSWAGGGFLGVDAFFVLSGFLITSLMLVEVRSTGRLDLRAFWLRRAKRLLPALFLLLVGVAAFAAFAASAGQVKPLRGDGLATFFYVANWDQVLGHRSYFDLFDTPSMLQHTWSLAIEEQWYLVWPLVLPLLVRVTGGKPVRLLGVIGALAAGSAVLMALLVHPGEDPSRAYFGTDTRAQSLLLGAALGVLVLWRPGPRSVAGRVALQAAGVGAAAYLAVLWVTVDDGDLGFYNGGFFIEALAVAVVIAAAVQPRRGPLRGVLSLGPLRWVGQISYGLYLWHWPVIVFLTPERTGTNGAELLVNRFLLTFAIATASYYLVELPIRRGRGVVRRPVMPRVLVPAALVAVVAALLVGTSDIAGLGDRRAATARTEDRVDASSAVIKHRQEVQQARALQSSVVNAVFFGDSSSDALALSYGAAVTFPQLAVQSAAVPGCGVARGKILPRDAGFGVDCSTWPAAWQLKLDQLDPDVAVVLLGAGEIFDRQFGDGALRFGSAEFDEYLRTELETMLGIVGGPHVPVVFLSTPCYIEKDIIPWNRAVPRVNEVFHAFAAAHADQVTWIDLNSYLCPLSKWRSVLDARSIFPDGVHFSQAGGELAWRWLGPELLRIVERDRVFASLDVPRSFWN